MYLSSSIGIPPNGTNPRRGPLPWREAMQLADRRLFDDYSRACAGVTVLEVLRRDATDPIVFWERVIRWLPRLFELKRAGERLVREGRRSQAEIDENLRWQMRHVYPPGYALGTEQEELARAQCALAKARWRAQAARTPQSAPVNPFPLQGLGQVPAPPAPDSPFANTFVATHVARRCVPGQAGSATCGTLVAPRAIGRVVIHTATSSSTAVPGNPCGNPVPLARIIAAVQNPPSNPLKPSSAHYYVDRDGTITQMISEANVAFHVIGHNRDTVGIEHADVCNRPDPYTTQLYERSAALVRDIARRHAFRLLVFGIDTNDVNAATVLGHSTIGHHGDPGPYWDWEYYAALLRWDGVTPGTRPQRFVSMVSQAVTPPTDWQVRSRTQVAGGTGACIPNSHCASTIHSYGDNYWKATANSAGTDAEFSFKLNRGGQYKVSLWWPKVSGACRATEVSAVLQKAGGPAMANAVFDQSRNNGKWNDVHTFTVPQTGAQGTLRIKRASLQAGHILADAVRVLKVA